MFDFLLRLDRSLFHFLNHDLANGLFDVVMPVITEVKFFYLPYLLLFALLIWKGRPSGPWCVLALVLAVAMVDPFCSRIVKEEVARLRPCWELADVRLLIPCGAGKSFPSSHAANNAAAALIIGFYFRRFAALAWGIAAAVAFSRIYVGVHYPGDVLGGAIIGALIAAAVLWGVESIRRLLRARSRSRISPVEPDHDTSDRVAIPEPGRPDIGG